MTSLRRAPFLSFAIVGGLLYSGLAAYLPWGRETMRVDGDTAAGIVSVGGAWKISGLERMEEERLL